MQTHIKKFHMSLLMSLSGLELLLTSLDHLHLPLPRVPFYQMSKIQSHHSLVLRLNLLLQGLHLQHYLQMLMFHTLLLLHIRVPLLQSYPLLQRKTFALSVVLNLLVENFVRIGISVHFFF